MSIISISLSLLQRQVYRMPIFQGYVNGRIALIIGPGLNRLLEGPSSET